MMLCAAAQAEPSFRLPDDARPLKYQLDLSVDPAEPWVYGSVTIDVELARETNVVWLNSGGRVQVQFAAWSVGSRWVPAIAKAAGEFLSVTTKQRLPPGRAQLHLSFRSLSTLGDSDAFFRRQVGGRWYLFSHFEPLRARRAFPCFDEPRWKTPWRLTVHTPSGYDAVANMPLVTTGHDPDARVRFEFAESPPLPSYLVALAVGRFRVEQIGWVRVLAPFELRAPLSKAVSTLKQLLDRAEARFAIPLPFPKLDLVVIPRFQSGAMENAGLITIDSQMVSNYYLPTVVLAHELVHQWFGDYVTCAWFDDTWLNESFAEWLSYSLAAEVDPSFDLEQHLGRMLRNPLGADLRGRGSAIVTRPTSTDTVMEPFAPYTYARGAALLRMLQEWMGAASFQRALTRYLRDHAFGSVTTADVSAALSAEAGRDLSAVLRSFLEQPGMPLVEAQLICDKTPHLLLRQRPLTPSAGKLWHIPLCISYENRRDCTILDGETGEVELKTAGCPQPTFAAPELRLFALRTNPSALDLGARVRELHQQLLAGAVSIGEVLRLLPPDAPVADLMALLSELEVLVPDEMQLHWRRFLRRLGLVRRARQLGPPTKNEANRLWAFLADHAVDPELRLELGRPSLPVDRADFDAAALLVPWPTVDNAMRTARTRRWAYDFLRTQIRLDKKLREGYLARLALANCEPQGTPNDYSENELAVCSSLRRQGAAFLALLAAE